MNPWFVLFNVALFYIDGYIYGYSNCLRKQTKREHEKKNYPSGLS